MSPELEKVPRSLLVCEKSNFLNEKSRHDIHVSKHNFNYKVSLIIKHLLNIFIVQLCAECLWVAIVSDGNVSLSLTVSTDLSADP